MSPRMDSFPQSIGVLRGRFPVAVDLTSTPTLTGGPVGATAGAHAAVSAGGVVEAYRYHRLNANVATKYAVELFDAAGHLKWSDSFHNLVTGVGLDKLMDACFKTGWQTPVWYIGLVNAAGGPPAYSAADTMAIHAGWAEFTAYEEAARPKFTAGTVAAGTVDNSDARAAFTISQNGTLDGCFLVNDKGDGELGPGVGILYGVGAFSGGERVVESGDTLRVTVTLSASD